MDFLMTALRTKELELIRRQIKEGFEVIVASRKLRAPNTARRVPVRDEAARQTELASSSLLHLLEIA
jgi:hypothetical protein